MVLNKLIEGALYYEFALRKANLANSTISLIGRASVVNAYICLHAILHNSISNLGPGFFDSFILIASIYDETNLGFKYSEIFNII
jgi:hypothetical protein